VHNETKDMYLAFKHVEKHMQPTPVHLQVFVGISTHTVRHCEPDHFPSLDVAHVLPVLFLFTMPRKHCIRAGAFKHVTDVQLAPLSLMHLNFSTSPTVTSQRLVLLDLSVFGYLAFEYSFPSSTS
jgi:hypothetical protein